MITMTHDMCASIQMTATRRYSVQCSDDLLDPQGLFVDWLIGTIFDELQGDILDLRIVPATRVSLIERVSPDLIVAYGH